MRAKIASLCRTFQNSCSKENEGEKTDIKTLAQGIQTTNYDANNTTHQIKVVRSIDALICFFDTMCLKDYNRC